MRSEERRLALASERGREAVASLAREACLSTMPLICRPPPPVEPFAYGDLVPLGFLLRAVNVDACGTSAVRRDLIDLLRGRRQGLLWPYHSGTLVTCIDSALVLQGFRDPAGVEALEIFASGRCGYLPQLCSEEPERDRMTVTPQNRYWCQPDYGTTCLVTALRAEAGLEGLKVRMISGTVLPRRVDGLLPGDVEAGWTIGKATTGGRPLHRGIAGSTQELSYPARRNFSLARRTARKI